MAYYGRYGHGLESFAREWGLNNMKAEELDPVVFDALQSFLNIISPERGYRLSFIESGTAATSFSTKRVCVTSEALRGLFLYDPERWERVTEAAKQGKGTKARMRKRSSGAARFRITAGMLCHEVSHIRYGQDTAGAVEKAYAKSKNKGLAQSISNILDENRIERAFKWDFEGFGEVFEDVREWVARKSNEGQSVKEYRDYDSPNRADALNLALRGSRFYKYTRCWQSDARQCIEFGRKWDRKYTKNDTVKLHLEGVAAMIEWLKQFPAPEREAPPEPSPFPPQAQPAPQQSDEDEDSEPEMGAAPAVDFGDEDDDEQDDDLYPEGEDTPNSEDDDESQDEYDDEGNPLDEEEDDDDADDLDEEDDDDGEGNGLSSVEPVDEDPSDEPVLTDEEAEEAVKDIPNTDKATDTQSTRKDNEIEREMQKALGAVEMIPEDEAGAEVRLTRNPPPVKGTTAYDVGESNAAIAHEVRLAFESTRYAHDEWASGYTTGRFRSRDAARAASGDLNSFSRRVSESSTRVHLALLVDYSGSMAGEPFRQACSLSQTLVEAMAGSQVYRQSVWQYKSPGWGKGTSSTAVQLNRLWMTGDSKSIQQALIDGGPADTGTPTGPALYALGHEVLADRKADEAMVILSITDGEPDNPGQVVHAVNYWGDKGVNFVGVNITVATVNSYEYRRELRARQRHDPSITEFPIEEIAAAQKAKMVAQYGEHHTIEFDGNWLHLAEDIGSVVGQALAGTIDK